MFYQGISTAGLRNNRFENQVLNLLLGLEECQQLSPEGFSTGFPLSRGAPGTFSRAEFLAHLRQRVFPWATLLESLPPGLRLEYPVLEQIYRLHQRAQVSGCYQSLMKTETVIPIASLEYWLCQLHQGLEPTVVRPVRVCILVEGVSEQILLPGLANQAGVDFARQGVLLKPVGGKKQMLQRYREEAGYVAGPLLILLDQDAAEIAEMLQQEKVRVKRPADQVFLLPEGELEDLYPDTWIVEVVNRFYRPHPLLTTESLKVLRGSLAETSGGRFWPVRQVHLLERLWQENQWGRFDKADFAQKLSMLLADVSSLPPMQAPVLDRLFTTLKEVL